MDPTKDTSPEFQRKFKWIKKLGNGSFGAVYLFESRITREKFACKVAVDPGAQEALLREVAILKRLHHVSVNFCILAPELATDIIQAEYYRVRYQPFLSQSKTKLFDYGVPSPWLAGEL
ncbi:uncharacterized protein ARB_06348 [Trichophyton benhamiae CBS 112371]|uniref:Protein kinase domain-containing protein n=1 Tax=Arthroderma benhamiae (strain ATCC MYA-4681 / CBS 112371) TaxID=663331 RepID=D4AQ41_ARTBC|nr:uncharacterized protein ARB_06348 [Trichophyton benhamiae CBS 112371]EFE34585.1 hypothetical protein ARB_06348 [Trichophyton benhamiae CBS 112371]